MSVDDDLAAFSQNNLPEPILTFDSIIHSFAKTINPRRIKLFSDPPIQKWSECVMSVALGQ